MKASNWERAAVAWVTTRIKGFTQRDGGHASHLTSHKKSFQQPTHAPHHSLTNIKRSVSNSTLRIWLKGTSSLYFHFSNIISTLFFLMSDENPIWSIRTQINHQRSFKTPLFSCYIISTVWSKFSLSVEINYIPNSLWTQWAKPTRYPSQKQDYCRKQTRAGKRKISKTGCSRKDLVSNCKATPACLSSWGLL